jgi:hypothetical protein
LEFNEARLEVIGGDPDLLTWQPRSIQDAISA